MPVITGTGNADTLIGGFGSDTIEGLAGNDTIDGYFGSDSLSGGDGNDTLIVYNFQAGDADSYDGGAGFDTLEVRANNTPILLNGFSGVEKITGAGFNGVSWGSRIVGSGADQSWDFSATTILGIDSIAAGAGNDTIVSSLSGDAIYGEDGNDLVYVSPTSGVDYVSGGNGSDTLAATADNMAISLWGFNGFELVTADGHSGVWISGTGGNDVLNFSGATLSGIGYIDAGGGNDTVTGTSGAEVLKLSGGTDTLTGGAGADTFDFDALDDSVATAARDVIADFAVGVDKLDISSVDADNAAAGDQAFTFIGNAAFSGAAGQLRMDDSNSAKTIVYGDSNGDGLADFSIELTGHLALTASDFVL